MEKHSGNLLNQGGDQSEHCAREKLVSEARKLVGISKYKLGTCITLAPAIVDCSTLTMWLFDKVNIQLERYCFQQIDQGILIKAVLGEKNLNSELLLPCDLIFTKGIYGMPNKRLGKKVGHVGLYTGQSVIHATATGRKVTEESLEKFTRKRRLREVRRYL